MTSSFLIYALKKAYGGNKNDASVIDKAIIKLQSLDFKYLKKVSVTDLADHIDAILIKLNDNHTCIYDKGPSFLVNLLN